MAKVTWLGEDTADTPGPSFTTCYGGIKFPKGEAVEISDPDTIKRARGNKYFEVSTVGRPPTVPAKPKAE
jgi:hypothetical protein